MKRTKTDETKRVFTVLPFDKIEDYKTAEVFPREFLEYRIATLHLCGVDCYIGASEDGSYFEFLAPRPVAPPAISEMPDADVLNLGPVKDPVPVSKCPNCIDLPGGCPVCMPDADVLN